MTVGMKNNISLKIELKIRNDTDKPLVFIFFYIYLGVGIYDLNWKIVWTRRRINMQLLWKHLFLLTNRN